MCRRHFAVVAALIVGAQFLFGQDCRVWREKRVFPYGIPVHPHTDLAYDRSRQRFILFGNFVGRAGPETWLSDGDSWWLASRTGPTPYYPRMAFDESRGVMVLVNRGETWEWDGAAWSLRTNSGPSARRSCNLAYDPDRRVTTLFGGYDDRASAFFGETWEWDGLTWQQRLVSGPSARFGHAMTYDRARHVTLLFGGRMSGPSGDIHLNDTWTWDGAAWTLVAQTGPSPRHFCGFAFDEARGECVLMGGSLTYWEYWNVYDDVWLWDGATWTRTASGPDGREGPRMDFDATRGVMLLVGGFSYLTGRKSDVWEWNGTSWRPTRGLMPDRHAGHVLFYDAAADQIVVTGGLIGYDYLTPLYESRSWLYRGGTWSATPWNSAPALTGAAVACDKLRGTAAMFGGMSPSGMPSGETWLWNAGAWRNAPVTGPSPRSSHCMTYDSARGVVLLFGGNYLGDTWQWDGAAWTLLANTGPAPRSGAAMAFDPVRRIAVLFGGYTAASGGVYFRDTWEWDGAAWTLGSSDGPAARVGHLMAFDERTGNTVLFGGSGYSGITVDTWEWDGDHWTRKLPRGPTARSATQMVYAAEPSNILLFGGNGTGGGGMLDDLWTYGPTAGHGDANCDGTINLFDIDPFVLALTSSAQWEAQYACDHACANDVNLDGSVNLTDIGPFIDLLSP